MLLSRQSSDGTPLGLFGLGWLVVFSDIKKTGELRADDVILVIPKNGVGASHTYHTYEEFTLARVQMGLPTRNKLCHDDERST